MDAGSENLSWERVPESLRALLRDLVGGKRHWPLFLHGKQGVGKSAVGKLLRASTFRSLMRDITHFEDIAFSKAGWDWLKEATLVIIDEVGARTSQSNEYSYRAMKRILDLREEHRSRAGVYISNLTMKQIPEFYDDRIASRMLCGTIYEMTGPDQRIAK